MAMNPHIANKHGWWETIELPAGCWCITQDAAGLLWIGTNHSGVAIYDGMEMRRVDTRDGLPSNSIYCIEEDSQGCMLIGTRSGLRCWDGDRVLEPLPQWKCLEGDPISSLHRDSRGRIWIECMWKLYVYSGGELVEFSGRHPELACETRDLYNDSQGNLLIVNANGIFVLDESDSVRRIDGSEELGPNLTGLCADTEGTFLVASLSGVYRYDGKGFEPLAPFQGEQVWYLRPDSEGNVWIVFQNAGAGCYDGTQLVRFGTKDGLASSLVSQVATDRDGGIWFSCMYGGITRYDPYGVAILSRDPVESPAAVLSTGDLFWSNGETVVHLRPDGTQRTLPFGNPTGMVQSVLQDKRNRIWVGGLGTLFMFDSAESMELAVAPELTRAALRPDEWAWCIYEDSEGVIWIGARYGLIRCEGDRAERIWSFDDPFPLNGVRAVVQNPLDGSIWAATEGAGLARYHEGKLSWYTTDHGLADNSVLCLALDHSGAIWYGTQGGVGVYDGTSFRNYTVDDGLPAAFTHSLYVDSEGHVWMGTIGNGACRFDGRDFQVLTVQDGLPSNNVTGIAQTPLGDYIFASFKGVCRYPAHQSAPPGIRILEVDAEQRHLAPREVLLYKGSSPVRIRYRGICYNSKHLRYRHTLEGLQHTWTATWDEQAVYRDLPEGEYTFKVIAINRDLVASEEPATLRLVVTADPRDRVISELEVRVQERTRELERANRHLAEVNAELNDFAYAVSHDLKAPLRGMTSLANWIAEDYREVLGDEGEEKLELLTGRADRMRGLIDGILRYSRLGRMAQEKELVDTRRLVADVVDLLAPPSQVDVRLEGDFPTVPTDRIRMTEVMQNLISNALRYGDKSHNVVTISCARDGEAWSFSVADNGPGIDPKYHEKVFRMFETLTSRDDTESTGVGLALVRKIVTMMGGRVWVESEPGSGAKFIFTIPAHEEAAHEIGQAGSSG